MTESTLKCPECDSLTLTAGLVTVTAMYCPSFSDDEGKWHTHDSNIEKANFTCRKCGCEFQEISHGSCWCGWSGGETTIKVIRSPKQGEGVALGQVIN